ncbi:uncharacterized protein LOC118435361 [Folsomia candida]|uniref:uncharacterized protein LOC118435361 n=1 Tax=Folsomia candida TaxID=158441 RepID=UPI0016054CA3|nr:uncharacterized protein LOC118435361 [Folsomia candida]XP_035707239.1 uncharacterized protein LOC118435361 [Folsomia candida]
MTTPRASWDLNLSDESDNEVENTANVNSEANAFANLFNGSGEKGIDNVAPLDSEIQDLLRDVEKSIEFGPEIMAEVAEGFNKTMCRPLSKETSDNLKNNFKIPINCKPFVIPKMNQEIWSHLPGPARFIDLNMQQNQFSLGIGLNALAQIANEVAKNASNIPKEVKISILKLAIDGGNILGDQIQSISKKRRLEVKKHINSEYHGICNSQIPVSEFLFGSDLNETLKASKTASNVIRKSFTRQGQNQRPQPYFNPRSSLNLNRPRLFTPQRQQFGQQQRGGMFPRRRWQTKNFLQQSTPHYQNQRK